jgi:hypothetical protein
MAIETGVVYKKFEKEFRGKTLYSFTLDDRDDKRFFRLGENTALFNSFNEGDTIKMKFEEDARGNCQVEKIKVEAEASEKPAPAKGGGSKGGRQTAAGRDDYWTEKARRDKEEIEPRISFYAALERATSTVALLVSAEAVKLPAKTKLAERQDAIDGLIEVYAAQYYRHAQDVPAFLEGTGHDTDKPVSLPDDDVDFEEDVFGEDEKEDDDF